MTSPVLRRSRPGGATVCVKWFEGNERDETKEAEGRLSELLPPCYIDILMIAAIAQRQAATLMLMFSLI
jgi:hypothetical protein